jgi:cytochrome c oxidase cbb3-type subunit 1
MSATIDSLHHSRTSLHDDGADTFSIDESVRLPVLALFGNAIHWLVVAVLISAVIAIKLIVPGFLNFSWANFLSYGRLAPIARDLFLYGWASQAALASGIWLAARLAGRPLASTPQRRVLLHTLLISATVLWNLGVVLGSLAIFAGYTTGVEWLEYPGWASATLFLSFLLIGIWAVLLFDRRSNEDPEVAQWYLVAGFCSFPWIYGTANLLLVWKPLPAPSQGVVQAWFSGSFLSLWLLPVALAALYAMIPRALGSPINRGSLAPLAFWSVLFLGGWNGIQRLIGGPVPAWMTSIGVVSSVLFLIPIMIISINLLGIDFGKNPRVGRNVPLRFLILGLFALITLGIIGAISSLPTISAALHFTGVSEAQTQLWILGAVTFPLFGVLYEGLPRLMGRECWSEKLSERHYWLTLVGFWLLIGMLVLEGLFTGLALVDPGVTFLNVASYAYPFRFIEVVAQFLLLAGTLMLGLNITRAFAGDYLFPKR